MEKRYRAKQASDSLLVGGLLSMSGGLQDAYTYHVRDQVFANAQTGNIVLLGQSIALGNWETAVRYLLPLLAFAAGVYAAEIIHSRFRTNGVALHWRHEVLLVEAALLFLVGWMPQSMNLVANILVSFGGVPGAGGQYLRHYHVYRQPAQRHGEPLLLAEDRR